MGTSNVMVLLDFKWIDTIFEYSLKIVSHTRINNLPVDGLCPDGQVQSPISIPRFQRCRPNLWATRLGADLLWMVYAEPAGLMLTRAAVQPWRSYAG